MCRADKSEPDDYSVSQNHRPTTVVVIYEYRSRYLSQICCAQAASSGLGKRTAFHHRANTEQKAFTDGHVIMTGNFTRRGKKKRPDYLLRYTRDFMIAVVEAKAEYLRPEQGLQQAKEYAESLSLKFAYAPNGHGIVEYLDNLQAKVDSIKCLQIETAAELVI